MKGAISGFTLIELVMVIVLMSIISLTSIEIINFTVTAYDKSLGRQTLGNSARIATDRISRELRSALPNSARVSGSCLEFIPINAAGSYVDLPVGISSASFQAVPFNAGQESASGRIAVYPMDASTYDLSSNIVSAAATLGSPDVNNEIQVSLVASHQFPNHSPSARFFLIADPVSFCLDGENLFRYEGYGFNSVQPTVSTLPSALPDRAVLVQNIGASITPFAVMAQSLQRNAIVAIGLIFSHDGESVQISHEVQLRNVQ
ncbi:MAG: MSHA biogenesis protein MshO [Candidatus Azotimanducaceae bacterium]|jgi:MSHA biogenesis protein MshO